MSKFNMIDPKQFQCNPFQMIGNQWMLITAEKDNKVNTMTAAWGGLGVIWNHNVAYIFIRQSRYTKEFIDGSDHFSLSFFDMNQYRKTLSYLGNVSGREEDKIAKAGLTVEHEQETPYFAEADTVLLCKKLSRHYIAPEGFLEETVDQRWYADHDYHDMYIGEIVEILKK